MRYVNIKDFVKEPDTISWIVKDLLPDVGWTLMVGKPGIGKTTFTMQMCVALQDGKPFLDRDTKQTNILFIQADSPMLEWKERLKDVAPHSKGLTMVEVPTRVLGNPTAVNWMAEHIHTKMKPTPGLIVFDSLAKLSHVQINTERVQDAIVMMSMIAGKLPWILIHHPPRGELRAAGHYSLDGTASNVWILMQSKLKIEKGRLVGSQDILLDKDSKGLFKPKAESSSDGDLMSASVI